MDLRRCAARLLTVAARKNLTRIERMKKLFCLTPQACSCDEKSIMAQLAAQAKQGPPGPAGIDGKPGMTGIPVSVTCDSFEYFNELFFV